MTGDEFRIWREGAGMTQARAGVLAGMSRKTVVRAEASEKVSPKLEAITRSDVIRVIPEPFPNGGVVKTAGGAAQAVKVKPALEPSAALKAAMLRNPPYATTAAEARAMRQLRAHQRGMHVSMIRLLPLRPTWARLPSGRQVNAAIPKPLDVAAPAWAGPRGVLTESGRVYDFEAAHRIHEPQDHGAAQVTAGQW